MSLLQLPSSFVAQFADNGTSDIDNPNWTTAIPPITFPSAAECNWSETAVYGPKGKWPCAMYTILAVICLFLDFIIVILVMQSSKLRKITLNLFILSHIFANAGYVLIQMTFVTTHYCGDTLRIDDNYYSYVDVFFYILFPMTLISMVLEVYKTMIKTSERTMLSQMDVDDVTCFCLDFRAVIQVFTVLIVSFIMSIIYVITNDVPHHRIANQSTRYISLFILQSVFHLYFPFLLILIILGLTLKALLLPNHNFPAYMIDIINDRKKTAGIISILVIIYILCSIPGLLFDTILLRIYVTTPLSPNGCPNSPAMLSQKYQNDNISALYLAKLALNFANPCINSVILIFASKSFRDELRKVWRTAREYCVRFRVAGRQFVQIMKNGEPTNAA